MSSLSWRLTFTSRKCTTSSPYTTNAFQQHHKLQLAAAIVVVVVAVGVHSVAIAIAMPSKPRYLNSTSTFHSKRLVESGDINPNPGPENCALCQRTVARNHRSLRCVSCTGILHIKCGDVRPNQFLRMNQTDVTSWKCPRCVVLSEFSELPFCGLDNVDFVREFSNYTNILLDLDQGNQLRYANDDAEIEADYANTSKKDPAGDVFSRLITSRQKDCRKRLLLFLFFQLFLLWFEYGMYFLLQLCFVGVSPKFCPFE